MDVYHFQPIGYVHSPFKDVKHMPKFYTESGGAEAVLEILPAYQDALLGVEAGMDLMMLFVFHASTNHDLRVHKRGTGPLTGVFATRSPRRPNQIGVSIIHIVSIDGTRLTITGVDTLDGTPVLDLKSAE